MVLEAHQYTDNSFWTLTYRDASLPHLPRHSDNNLPTLLPVHLKNFLKRLRTSISPRKVRFFAVGEYGDLTNRPHYHVILFNYPPCRHLDGTRLRPLAFDGTAPREMTASRCCAACADIQKLWPHGHILGGRAEDEAMQYCAGYTVKKLSKNYPGLEVHPEFSRQSNRPGLGATALPEIADIVLKYDVIQTHGDVPSSVRQGKRILPIGRYLRGKLREQVGLPKTAPPATLDLLQEELLPLREAAFNSSQNLQNLIVDINKGSVLSAEAKARIRKKRSTL